MAGGTWTTQNKVRPGVYINTVSAPRPPAVVGDRGVVSFALPLPWGPSKEILTINAGDETRDVLGYDITAPEMLLVREAMKRASTILLYRLNTGTKAAATAGNLTATAQHGGVRGNDIKIIVQQSIDDPTHFEVTALLQDDVVDRQTVTDVAVLTPNRWVVYSGNGVPTVTAGLALEGGTDGAVTNQDHVDYLADVELQEFNTLALVSTDAALKNLYTAFVKRLRETEGVKVQVALENAMADYEGVISVKNGVLLSDGTTLTAAQATVWTAAATAGAQVNQSLTYQAYDDAVDANPRYTNSQIEAALRAGEFVFVQSGGRVIVEQDINSLTTYSDEKAKHFAKNRVLRVLDGFANDIKRIFETLAIGQVDNNEDGRNILRARIITYMNSLQAINAIQSFDSQTDVRVMAGTESDSVYVEVDVQPVDSVEKIYMKVQVS